MFMFKTEKIEELLDGRTVTYFSKKVGITREYLSYILNGKKSCSKTTAYCIAKASNSDAEIDDFFDRTE